MNKWFFLLAVFNLTRSELLYSLYNITSVPPLDNVCGLSKAQVQAAQQSTVNVTVTATQTVQCQQGQAQTQGQAQQPQPADVYAMCTGDECYQRQRELVECLTYEEVAGYGLDNQVTLDAESLSGQLANAMKATARTTAELFDLAGQLDEAFAEHRRAVDEAAAVAKALSEQREAVHKAHTEVERLNTALAEAKTTASAHSKPRKDPNDFGVYANGCRPDEQRGQKGEGGGCNNGPTTATTTEAASGNVTSGRCQSALPRLL